MSAERLPPVPLVAGLASFGLFFVCGQWLTQGVDVLAHSSGIFDMDVARVVVDWTSDAPGLRTSAHPLQKLLVAPLGSLLHTGLGVDALVAARLLAAAAAAAAVAASAWLARAWSDGSGAAAALAGGLAATSFASLLAGALPESAVLAGLTTLAPLVWRELHRGAVLGARETAGWALLAVLGAGATLSQAGVVAVVAALRGREVRATSSATTLLRHGVAGLAGALVLFALASELQARAFPGSARAWDTSPLASEAPFLRHQEALAAPGRHVLRLLGHFAVLDFVAPRPAYSGFLRRDYGIETWSLSLEEAPLAAWGTGARTIAGAWLFALGVLAWKGRWRDPRLGAAAGVLAFHFALHLLYGREYVLYAPHWHGVLVALVVSAAWNGALPRRGVVAVGASFALLFAVQNLAVLAAVKAEVAHGLGTEQRDPYGRPLGATR